MTQSDLTLKAPRLPRALVIIGAASVIGSIALVARFVAQPLHTPNWSLITGAPLVIQIHLGAVVMALSIGAVLLIGPKGRVFHRTLGWVWSLFMLTAAVASLFVRGLGNFGPLHVLSAVVLVMVPLAIYNARRHRVGPHSRTMASVFLGGILLAGTFAFLPDRLLWQVFFG